MDLPASLLVCTIVAVQKNWRLGRKLGSNYSSLEQQRQRALRSRTFSTEGERYWIIMNISLRTPRKLDEALPGDETNFFGTEKCYIEM